MAKFYDSQVYPPASTLSGSEVFIIYQNMLSKTVTFSQVISDLVTPLVSSVVNNMADLNDTVISNPLTGHTLFYNSTTGKWNNAYAYLTSLNDTNISSPLDGQALIYSSGSGKWDNVFMFNQDLNTTDAPTFAGITVNGHIRENIYVLSGTTPELNPSNGTIQTWTLTGNSAPTDGLSNGESIDVLIDDGADYTITWPSVVWKTNGGTAPTLNTTGYTVIILFKVGGILYGSRVGDA